VKQKWQVIHLETNKSFCMQLGVLTVGNEEKILCTATDRKVVMIQP